ncbi:G5 domain-containing protein [Candidatus Saccharibacteria bacterium]|nr:G5 domain-containing protein [Candidatus Saccharibacteria bacterium]
MRWSSHLKKPAKVFIIIMVFVVLLFLAGIIYLEVTDSLSFESISHYFVGDTESEITVDEEIPYEKQEIKDSNLDEGVTEIRQEGKKGKKTITFRVTKDKDGNEINRVYVGEKVAAEAVDEIIAIGTRAPATANSNDNQGGQSGANSQQQASNSTSTQPTTPATNQNSQQQTNNNSQPNNNGPHYCTSPYQIEQGDEGWYVKVNIPCSEMYGKWSAYTVEVAEADYYSRKVCNKQAGPADLIIEVRCGK